MFKNCSEAVAIIVVAWFFTVTPAQACARSYSSRGYSAYMNQARQSYQMQMNLFMAEQKAMLQAEQQAVAAQAAEEKRKHDAHVKANRVRIDRENQRREAAIAKRKAENAAKGEGTK